MKKKHFKKNLFIQIVVVLLLFIPSYFLLKNLAFESTPIEYISEREVSKPVSPPDNGAFLGISFYDQDIKKLLEIEKNLDKHFAIVGIYQSWGDKNNKFNFYWAKQVSDHESIPFITWEPWKPVAGFDRSEMKVYQPEYQLKNIINGNFDTYITQYAKDVRKFGKPVMIRFAHEMNGNWYAWGSTFNTPEDYIGAWRHVHDIFVAEGATNATWVWSPNEIYIDPRIPFADDILQFYPGDDYVDWVGFSAFNWANQYKHNVWKDPQTMYPKTVKILLTLNKPIMITETASAEAEVPSKKAVWIKALATYVAANPEIRAVIWFNIEDNGIDWSIDSTPSSENSFKEAFSDYFIYNYRVQN